MPAVTQWWGPRAAQLGTLITEDSPPSEQEMRIGLPSPPGTAPPPLSMVHHQGGGPPMSDDSMNQNVKDFTFVGGFDQGEHRD